MNAPKWMNKDVLLVSFSAFFGYLGGRMSDRYSDKWVAVLGD